MAVQESKGLSFLEYEENSPEDEIETKGALYTPKSRRGHRKLKKYGSKNNYHL